eukprot:4798379-Amphidinium_carterae.2
MSGSVPHDDYLLLWVGIQDLVLKASCSKSSVCRTNTKLTKYKPDVYSMQGDFFIPTVWIPPELVPVTILGSSNII